MSFTMLLNTEEGKSIVGGFNTIEEANAFSFTMGFDAEDVTLVHSSLPANIAEGLFEDIPF